MAVDGLDGVVNVDDVPVREKRLEHRALVLGEPGATLPLEMGIPILLILLILSLVRRIAILIFSVVRAPHMCDEIEEERIDR